MSTNQSEFLGLHVWEPEDVFLRTEFNENFNAIDGAISEEIAARTEAVHSLEERLTSTSGSMSTSVAQVRQELSASIQAEQAARSQGDANLQSQVDAVRAKADAAYAPDHAPYVIGSYSGTGKSGSSNPCSITVGFAPSALLICPAKAKQSTNLSGDAIVPPSHFFVFSTSTTSSSGATVTWLSNGVSWYADSVNDQCNASGNTYFYIVFR